MLKVVRMLASNEGESRLGAAAVPAHSAAAVTANAGTIAVGMAQTAVAGGRMAVSNTDRTDEANVASAEGTVPSCNALSEV